MPQLTFLLLVLACATIPAQAFDGPGHMQVADIAWTFLAGSAATQAAVKAILKKARGQFKLTGNDPDKLRDKFDLAATFPDFIKGATDSPYEPMIAPMNLTFWTASQARAHGREGVRCKSWHYLDTPLFVPAGAVPDLPTSNLVAAHNEGVRRLKQLKQGVYDGPTFAGLTNDDLKFWWLGWLLHLTGDAHQPLHCASHYNLAGNEGKPDAGGNLFKLAGGQKLHGYWDGALEAAASDDGFSIGGAPTSAQPGAILGVVSDAWRTSVQTPDGSCGRLDPADWIAEGAATAKSVAYSGIQPGDSPSTAYRNKTRKQARQGAVVAGCRLAKVLSGIWG